MIDFAGFVGLVDALGGVDVCIAQPIKDPKANLDIKAGLQTVDGRTALGLVRERYAVGNGSDLARIGRQQQFVGAMIRKIQSAGILLNPVRLFNVMDAATKSLTTDPGLASVQNLVSLARSVQGIPSGNITFVTVPTVPWSQDRNRVVFQQDSADAIWSALKADTPVPTGAVPGSAAMAPPSPASTPTPSQVSLRILNGTARPGLARQVAAALRQQGFRVLGIGSAPARNVATTVVQHGAGDERFAQVVARAASGAPQVIAPTAGHTVTLLLGSDFTTVTPLPASGNTGTGSPTATPPPAPSTSAADSTCLGSKTSSRN